MAINANSDAAPFPMACSNCGVTKYSLEAMRVHIRQEHTHWAPFECLTCHTRRTTEEQMREHNCAVHKRGPLLFRFHDDAEARKNEDKNIEKSMNFTMNNAIESLVSVFRSCQAAQDGGGAGALIRDFRQNEDSESDKIEASPSPMLSETPQRFFEERLNAPRPSLSSSSRRSQTMAGVCGACQRDITQKNRSNHIFMHLANQHNLHRYHCKFDYCDYKAHRKDSVEHHMARNHGGVRLEKLQDFARDLQPEFDALADELFGTL